MQVKHSIYFGDTIDIGKLLGAIAEHHIPNTAYIEFDSDDYAMSLVWMD